MGTQRVNVQARGLAVDAAGTAYLLTTSGLSVVPLDPASVADRPAVNNGGTVNLASFTAAMAPGSLVSIFGKNLGRAETATGTPLPTMMGGVCVTLNNRPLPLFMTSSGQVNAQVPTDLAAGRYPLVIRSIEKKTASTQQVAIAKYAPGIFVDTASKQSAIYHSDGTAVTKDHPARRDQRLVLYATGLGPKAARRRPVLLRHRIN